MFKNDIQENLKLEIIKRFIIANNRIPNTGELNDLIKSINSKMTDLKKTGLFLSVENQNINKEISLEELNLSINDINFNLSFFKQSIEDLWNSFSIKVLETVSALTNTDRYLRNINAQASSLLMNNKFNSNLLYIIHEDFSKLNNLLITESTCEVGSFGAQGYTEKIPLTIESIDSQVIGNSFSKHKIEGTTLSLLEDDTSYFVVTVINQVAEKNSLVLTSSLDSLKEVGIVKFNYISSHNDTLHFYTFDENQWSLIEAIDSPNDVTNFIVNKTISKFKILITRNSYDYEDNGFISLFKIDSIKCFTHSTLGTSELYMGPYTLKDSMGENAIFNFIQLDVCEVNREHSYIEYYISSDNSNWIPVLPVKNKSGNSIIFFNSNNSDIHEKINSNLNYDQIDYSNLAELELTTEQAVLNFKLPIAYKDLLSPNAFTIKRNITSSSSVFGVSSGWSLDYQTNESLYKTTIENLSDGDIILDIGNSSAYVDGVLISNILTITPGIHEFATSQSNWFDIEGVYETEKDLISNDPLYPFNHKFLIEGYAYPSTFTGNKVYVGLNSNYGTLLQKVDKDELESSSSLNYYSLYTDENYIYIIVNTLKGFSDWINELYEIKYYIPDNTNSEIYLKAIFYSHDLKNTSLLKNFTIKAG